MHKGNIQLYKEQACPVASIYTMNTTIQTSMQQPLAIVNLPLRQFILHKILENVSIIKIENIQNWIILNSTWKCELKIM